MELGELKVDHLVLQLEDTTHGAVENVAQNASLLWMHDLVVTLLQTSEDLDVLDVHRRQQLKRSQPILKEDKHTDYVRISQCIMKS